VLLAFVLLIFMVYTWTIKDKIEKDHIIAMLLSTVASANAAVCIRKLS
jgi:hypothetical protein